MAENSITKKVNIRSSAFKEGGTKLPNSGRKKGVKNKITYDIKGRLDKFIDENFDVEMTNLLDLDPITRAKLFTELLKLRTPKARDESEIDSEQEYLSIMRTYFEK